MAMDKNRVKAEAANLLGNDRENVDPEYTRAIVELVNNIAGSGSSDDLDDLEEELWTLALAQ